MEDITKMSNREKSKIKLKILSKPLDNIDVNPVKYPIQNRNNDENISESYRNFQYGNPYQYPIYPQGQPLPYPLYQSYPFYQGKLIQNGQLSHDSTQDETNDTKKNPNYLESQKSISQKDEINKIDEENYGKTTYLILGLLLGTVLDFFTVLIMVTIGILIENRQFRFLNSMRPQEIICTFIKTLIKTCINLSMKS